ncbi:MAG: hypothetical protein CMP21_00910 [Rickettsiales bacterium]|nr:hypothetical protein [Rickettsiales bacterium]|tara:strand:- start:9833 stop:11122 length:1290 start_codon:yes stop_codon:yes gene_type:complete
MKTLIIFVKKKLNSEFNRSVLKLVTGTGLAQLIAIAVSPLLTRLYTPEHFGQYGLYLSIVAIITVGVSGQYEHALMLPKSHRKASQLLALCLLLTFSFSILVSLGIYIYQLAFSHIIPLENWIYILPISSLLTGIFNSLTSWTNRLKQYKVLSLVTVIQRLSSSLIQLLTPLLLISSVWGLIIGQITGLLITCVSIGILAYKKKHYFIKTWNLFSIKKLAKEYKNFPQFSTVSAWLNTLSLEIPVLLLSFYFEAKEVGYYILAKQVVQLPMSIIGQSVGKVFFQQASAVRHNTKQLSQIFISTIKKLFMIGIIPMTILVFWGDHLFVFVFGKDWKTAGIVAQILAPWLFFFFIISPVSSMYSLLNKLKTSTLHQIFILSSRIIIILIGCIIFKNFYITMFLLSLNNLILNILNIIYFSYTIKKKLNMLN